MIVSNRCMVDCIDSVVARLTDGIKGTRKRRRGNYDDQHRHHHHDDNTDASVVGLEKPFEELRNLLLPCLSQGQSNVSAFLVGPRGCGKSLVVERCLSSIETGTAASKFRVVRLNGMLLAGNDVAFVIKEIVRQLSTMTLEETKLSREVDFTPQEQQQPQQQQQQQQPNGLMERFLSFRNSTFDAHMAWLDEVLRLARVEQRPIVFVLQDFDALLTTTTTTASSKKRAIGSGSRSEPIHSERQVLLYHLLDRVAGQKSSLCVIATTSDLGAMSMLEKRVKSRAEGTSKVLHLRPHNTYNVLLNILTSHFDGIDHQATSHDSTTQEERTKAAAALKKAFLDLVVVGDNASKKPNGRSVATILKRSHAVGKDVRWFLRVLLVCMTQFRGKCLDNYNNDETCSFQHLERCLEQGLACQGVTFCNDVALNPRTQALLDLARPHLCLVLAARRILARDSEKDNESLQPLTLDRMMNEYQSSYKGSTDRFRPKLLRRSFLQLLETGVVVASSNHSGGAPLQYEFQMGNHLETPSMLAKLPLHMPISMERELSLLLKQGNLLDCSTALKEWGRRSN